MIIIMYTVFVFWGKIIRLPRILRIKIMHNIGLVFVRMGQYSEACTSFEYIMQEEANFKTGLDLVTAYYALGDKERMKKGFLRLLECQLDIDDDEKYTASSVSI